MFELIVVYFFFTSFSDVQSPGTFVIIPLCIRAWNKNFQFLVPREMSKIIV